ncbi:MAG: HlyD family efflux transporter periplasmic adaptor subunit [Cyanobacteria bacterium P01_D01_bin.105]
MKSTFNKSGANGNGHVNSNGNGQMNGQMNSQMNGQMNGNGGNGNGSNGSFSPGDGFQAYVPQAFDKPVILRQSPVWAKWIAISIMSFTALAVLSSIIFKVDENIGAQGKLEPRSEVQLVQAPAGGVVDDVLVEEGERVETGEILATLDETNVDADIRANQEITRRLREENTYYDALLSGDVNAIPPEGVSPALAQRASSRASLIESNRLYRAQLGGDTAGLSSDQIALLEDTREDLGNEQSINRSRAGELREQLDQTRIQLKNARSDLETNQEILDRLARLFEEGAVAELSKLQQEQEVNNKQAEVNTLEEEIGVLTFQISQAESQVNRTDSSSRVNLRNRLEDNKQRIEDIDSQLGQRIIDNNQRLEELESQLVQLQTLQSQQAITAPIAGTVFNLKANQPGYVANSTEPLMEIVPEDALVARIFIPNQDIGFVELGQTVDVRIDAYSYSEFGDMEGKVTKIGTDALPPDEIYPYYRFPAEVTLDGQQLISNGVPLDLRSGMSLSANINLRKRRIITFFTDIFVQKVDALKGGQ